MKIHITVDDSDGDPNLTSVVYGSPVPLHVLRNGDVVVLGVNGRYVDGITSYGNGTQQFTVKVAKP